MLGTNPHRTSLRLKSLFEGGRKERREKPVLVVSCCQTSDQDKRDETRSTVQNKHSPLAQRGATGKINK